MRCNSLRFVDRAPACTISPRADLGSYGTPIDRGHASWFLIDCTKFGTLTMKGQEKRLPAVFYRTEKGNEPVREWLKALPRADRLLIGEDIKDVEFSWPIGMPLCRGLGHGIWEIRTDLKDRIARVLFCVCDEEMVLLHGFIKKTQKTPAPDLELARERKRKLEKAK